MSNEIETLLQEVRKSRKFGTAQIVIMFFVALILIYDARYNRIFPNISNDSNNELTANLHVPDPILRMESKAEKQGYYTRAQFAYKHGVKERQVDLWREKGLIKSEKMENGTVRIPLGEKRP